PGVLPLDQFGPNHLENAAQPIPPTGAAFVPIVPTEPDASDPGIAGSNQLGGQVWVLSKFEPNQVCHNSEANQWPVGAPAGRSSEVMGVGSFGGEPDLLLRGWIISRQSPVGMRDRWVLDSIDGHRRRNIV